MPRLDLLLQLCELEFLGDNVVSLPVKQSLKVPLSYLNNFRAAVYNIIQAPLVLHG